MIIYCSKYLKEHPNNFRSCNATLIILADRTFMINSYPDFDILSQTIVRTVVTDQIKFGVKFILSTTMAQIL